MLRLSRFDAERMRDGIKLAVIDVVRGNAIKLPTADRVNYLEPHGAELLMALTIRRDMRSIIALHDFRNSDSILVGEHNTRTAAESQEILKGPIGQALGVDHLFEQEAV